MNLFYAPNISLSSSIIDPQEVTHIQRVLRSKLGDLIQCTDGKGTIYNCKISSLLPKEIHVEILNETKQSSTIPYLHIAIAPTKNTDRIEWFLEKSTELGVQEISFFYSDRSERREIKNYDRLEKCIISALKQSKNTYLPKLNKLISYKEFLLQQISASSEKYICYCDEKENSIPLNKDGSNNLLFLIGPEGDFSPQEVEKAKSQGFKPIMLSKTILRTETAGIYICAKYR